ncbi:MAG: flippase-like domain-containing protein [Deltaproteobacteria bacterium]|nr:flippase-like domain-containing protein [Deltaproteobacteria bacterium]
MSNKHNQAWRAFQTFAAAMLLWLMVRAAGIDGLKQALLQLTWGTALYLLLLSAVMLYVGSLKWKLFINHVSRGISTLQVMRIYLIGYFVNLVLPSYVGGDVVRSFYAGRKIGHHEAIATVLLERLSMIVVVLLILPAALYRVGISALSLNYSLAALIVVSIGAAAFSLVRCVLKRTFSWGMSRAGAHVEKVRQALHVTYKAPRLFVKAMLLSFLYHALSALNVAASGYAVGWEAPPLLEIFILLPFVFILTSLPVTPSSLGVQEGAFFLMLNFLGASEAQALAAAMVLRAKSIVLAMLGGICWLCQRDRGDRIKFL